MPATQMKKAIIKSFGRKGEEIVNMNIAAIDRGADVEKVEIPKEWAKLQPKAKVDTRNIPDFIKNVVEPMNRLMGDDLKVSAFKGREDGTFPSGTTQYEKRGIAVNVPEWISENCIQCNQCSFVCPHACIRPFLLDGNEMAGANGMVTLKPNGKGFEGLAVSYTGKSARLYRLRCLCRSLSFKGKSARHETTRIPGGRNWPLGLCIC